jgi:putative ABC transport system ATP-binding protein
MRHLNKTEPIIVARGLTMIFRTQKIRLKALSGVNISVDKGEFLAIVGTSGSGKTTLLSLLAGLDSPSAGRIAVGGRGIHRLSQEALGQFRRENTRFIFQSFNLFETLSAEENVAFPLMVCGMGRSERLDKARDMLTRFGLEKHFNHKPGELSGGQQQRVSIARAMITGPEIIFADEPTGNLDSKTAHEIMEELKNLNQQQGTTILMVTHDMAIAEYADRVLRIEDGMVV